MNLKNIVVLISLIFSSYSSAESCQIKVIEKVTSSGATLLDAVLFERQCESKSFPTIEVSVSLSSADTPVNKQENVYVSEGYSESYQIKWIENNTLLISGDAWNEWSKSDGAFVLDVDKGIVHAIKIEYENN